VAFVLRNFGITHSINANDDDDADASRAVEEHT